MQAMAAIPYQWVQDAKKVYFIGIGGAGMSALAKVLKHRGLQVAGSDKRENRSTNELVRQGMEVFYGQQFPQFGSSDLIVYSSAISENHVELKAARESGKRVCHRAEVLSCLVNEAQTSVAITGTHGKTTTSAMISWVLSQLKKDPTCLIGSDVLNFGTNTVLGNPDLVVAEVDESDRSHQLYSPNYVVLTNLEEDHMDHYKDLSDLERSFENFLKNARNPGLVVYSNEDPLLRKLIPASGRPSLSFGFSPEADLSAGNIRLGVFESEFDLLEHGLYSSTFRLSVPGLHNIANALAATAILIQLGLETSEIQEPLSQFLGSRRRLEVKWESPELMIVDDYAHHPTEVKASLRALKSAGKRLTVIFQPHRFTRTRFFYKEFAKAFDQADEVILTEVYGAGESNEDGAGVQMIYEEMLKHDHPPVQVMSKQELIPILANRKHLEGIIAFVGAGDIGEIADEFANRLKSFATTQR